MLQTIKQLLSFGKKVDYAQMVKQGAVILDVRSKKEYATGHIKGSVNISVDTLPIDLNKYKKDKIIITCCASGMRSGVAKNILKTNGFNQVYNGGSWISLKNKI